jgi:hypothetical protein
LLIIKDKIILEIVASFYSKKAAVWPLFLRTRLIKYII